MESSKRSLNASKGSTSKGKVQKLEDMIEMSVSRASLDGPLDSFDLQQNQLLLVKQEDLPTVLPTYSKILTTKNSESGVIMKDLDQVQHELEKLLSTCVVRQRGLRNDFDSYEKNEARKEKRGKSSEKNSTKRRKNEEKPRHKNVDILRMLKTKQPTNSLQSDNHELVGSSNETCDRFWLSVDAYCQDATKDNLVFLEELIKECSQETDVKIPVLGEHYATEWSDHGIQEEQTNGCITADSLQEEKTIASLFFQTVLDKFKSGEYIKGINGVKNGLCLEKRLRKEGILNVDDFSKSISREDEILMEIKKCQKELETVNQHNLNGLNKLREAVRKDIRKQEVKAALVKVDQEVLSIYAKIQQAKEKQQDLTEFEHQANAILRQQGVLHGELAKLSDLTLLE